MPTIIADDKKSYSNRHPVSSFSPPTRDKVNSDERTKTRKSLNREKRGLKLDKEMFAVEKREENFGDEFPSTKKNKNSDQSITKILREGSSDKNDETRRLLLESEKSKRKEKLKDIADSLTKPRLRRIITNEYMSLECKTKNQIKPTRDGECSEDERESSGTPISPMEKNELNPVREKAVS